jgi:hypothetical protein
MPWALSQVNTARPYPERAVDMAAVARCQLRVVAVARMSRCGSPVMVPNASRGFRVYGLVAYLMGPGRFRGQRRTRWNRGP